MEHGRYGARRRHRATHAFTPNPGEFYSGSYRENLGAMIEHIVDIEGPIHEEVLIRRIARHHRFQRAGRQIQEIVLKIARRKCDSTKEAVGRFFWKKGRDVSTVPARYKGRDDDLRNVSHIAIEELRAIAEMVATEHDPVEFARALGIARLSSSARARIETAFVTVNR